MSLREKEKIKNKKKNNIKDNKSQLLLVGSFILIIIGLVFISFNFVNNSIANMEEQDAIDEFIEIQNNYISSGEINPGQTEGNKIIANKSSDFIAVIEIPKINLRKGLYSKDSSNNDVNKNIAISKNSNMPDEYNGNLILVAHSGTGRIAYFKNLHKLQMNDQVYIYYKSKKYIYKLVNSYDIEKNGEAHIFRNVSVNVLTLITCKDNTNKQTIFILEKVEVGDVNG